MKMWRKVNVPVDVRSYMGETQIRLARPIQIPLWLRLRFFTAKWLIWAGAWIIGCNFEVNTTDGDDE